LTSAFMTALFDIDAGRAIGQAAAALARAGSLE